MTNDTRAPATPNVGTLVGQRIERLQGSFLNNSSTTRALLAQLRHAASKPPGSVPEIWDITAFPVPEFAPDAPTFAENAVHDAMTLYAIAQQGNTRAVHKHSEQGNRRGFGDAVRALAWQSGAEEQRFRRRFNAAVTSESYEELVKHVVSLVRQIFRSGLNITLDFGSLATDLFVFQLPDGPQTVRRRWARQYAARPFDADK